MIVIAMMMLSSNHDLDDDGDFYDTTSDANGSWVIFQT